MSNQTFLPEDYLAQKAERRTNLICLALFAVVMMAVVGAFLVTNRQWSRMRNPSPPQNRTTFMAMRECRKAGRRQTASSGAGRCGTPASRSAQRGAP